MTTSTTTPATPAKLRDGNWGARVQSSDIAIGAAITVTTKAGKQWNAVVSEVIWRGGDACLCRTRKSAAPRTSSPRKPATPRARTGGRCRGCRGAIKDAPQHRAIGGYCGPCAFDEFDM